MNLEVDSLLRSELNLDVLKNLDQISLEPGGHHMQLVDVDHDVVEVFEVDQESLVQESFLVKQPHLLERVLELNQTVHLALEEVVLIFKLSQLLPYLLPHLLMDGV